MKHLLKDNFTGDVANPKTELEYSFEDDKLSFTFTAHDSNLKSYSNIKNDSIWKENTVEVFLDFFDQDYYYEIEVAPNGTTFVALKYQDKLVFIDDEFFKSNVKIGGNTYIVNMEIDLKLLGKTGDFKFNAFRIEGQSLQALNPTFCDTFHIRYKFLESNKLIK